MTKRALVWYAAYGSNLSAVRFSAYLNGGQPLGSGRKLPGSRSTTPPRQSIALTLEHALYFACRSATWGGAVAFVDPRRDRRFKVLARGYLIQLDQLEDVIAQENGVEPGAVHLDLARLREAGSIDVLKRTWYRRALICGELDSWPIVTCTAAWGIEDVRPAAPSSAYLRWIAAGLVETWQLSLESISKYLRTKPGISSQRASPSAIRSLFAEALATEG